MPAFVPGTKTPASAADSEMDILARGAMVEIRDHSSYFTVYDLESDKPIGTITRPRRFPIRETRWTASDTSGNVVARSIGPRSAMHTLMRTLRPLTLANLAGKE